MCSRSRSEVRLGKKTTKIETSRQEDLKRIREALDASVEVYRSFDPKKLNVEYKSKNNPVTDLDYAVNRRLAELLPRQGEGWLSEESADDPMRLQKSRCWIVDPLDGTRELVAGVPEWCFSVGLVEEGRAVAGGILNPVTDEMFLGAVGLGVTLNGKPVVPQTLEAAEEGLVLASRSEMRRGEWDRFGEAGLRIRPMGSVAYKLACVAGGLAQATWTLIPKNEWDIAAGAALVTAAGGWVVLADGSPAVFNRPDPKVMGFVAFAAGTEPLLKAWESKIFPPGKAPASSSS